MNKKEIAVSSVKVIFSNIPVVGGLLDEIVFEHRSRIKQDRINRFALLLQEYFEEHGISNEEFENIKSEDFSDVFESVLQRVVNTKNLKKLERFRSILLGQLQGNQNNDFVETYLDITSRLDDNQILILEKFAETKVRLDEIERQKEQLDVKIREAQDKAREFRLKAENGTIKPEESIAKADKDLAFLKFEKSKAEQEEDRLLSVKRAGYYQLNDTDFEFYLQDLVSKSLMKDVNVTFHDTTTVTIKKITEFGIRYINFLNGN